MPGRMRVFGDQFNEQAARDGWRPFKRKRIVVDGEEGPVELGTLYVFERAGQPGFLFENCMSDKVLSRTKVPMKDLALTIVKKVSVDGLSREL